MEEEPVYWRTEKQMLFCFSFVFFALHLVPLSGTFWSHLIAQKGNLFFTTFTALNYFPSYIGNGGYYDLRDFVLLIGLTVVLTSGWLFVGKKNVSYEKLYQWTRVVLRYKLAAVLLTYAIVKIFPLQLPEPTLSDLNTEYGDFTKARIYELTVGVAKAHYQTAVGLTELLAVILLFFRRTATLGAIIASGTLLNIVLAGFAYQTGTAFYALYLMLISIFLIAHDLPSMYALLMEKSAKPNISKLDIRPFWSGIRTVLKTAFVLMAIMYSVTVYRASDRSYLLPEQSGLSKASGLYDVTEFRINNQLIPYSNTNPDRWQDVVFEKWNTISIRKAVRPKVEIKPVTIGVGDDASRRWESSGSAGRHYFSYTKSANLLVLRNKNTGQKEEMTLRYARPDTSTIILTGRNSVGDSIYVALKKLNKKYLLIKGRRKPVTL